jgi:hypothetical protein
MVKSALVTLGLACAGCQWILSIDPNVTVLDGGVGSSCASSGAILCDDFEEGVIDPGRWQQLTQNSCIVTVDQQQAHSGSYSLHASSAAVTTIGSIIGGYAVHIDPSIPSDFFVRFYVYVPTTSATPSKSQIVSQLVDGSGAGMQIDVNAGYLALTSWANVPELDLTSTTRLTAGSWHCVEWEAQEGTPGQTALWIDGTSVGDLGVGVTAPAYNQVQLGIGFFHPPVQPAFDVWIDDVVVQATRVGCN